jgi:hypothetical protein
MLAIENIQKDKNGQVYPTAHPAVRMVCSSHVASYLIDAAMT